MTYTQPTTIVDTATIQDLSYTYDTVGNITQIVDASETDTSKTTDYSYDDLYRLLETTVTNAVDDNNGTLNYAYDILGNITSRSDKGTYAYDGDIDSSYANPHAVTSIEKIDATMLSFAYDRNGNMTGDGTTVYAWDYQGRLTSSTDTTSTSYTYDHAMRRVSKTSDSGTTYYPTSDYSVEGSTITAYVTGPSGLTATLEDDGATSTTSTTLHTDHLGSTSVVTDEDGIMIELLDYHYNELVVK